MSESGQVLITLDRLGAEDGGPRSEDRGQGFHVKAGDILASYQRVSPDYLDTSPAVMKLPAEMDTSVLVESRGGSEPAEVQVRSGQSVSLRLQLRKLDDALGKRLRHLTVLPRMRLANFSNRLADRKCIRLKTRAATLQRDGTLTLLIENKSSHQMMVTLKHGQAFGLIKAVPPELRQNMDDEGTPLSSPSSMSSVSMSSASSWAQSPRLSILTPIGHAGRQVSTSERQAAGQPSTGSLRPKSRLMSKEERKQSLESLFELSFESRTGSVKRKAENDTPQLCKIPPPLPLSESLSVPSLQLPLPLSPPPLPPSPPSSPPIFPPSGLRLKSLDSLAASDVTPPCSPSTTSLSLVRLHFGLRQLEALSTNQFQYLAAMAYTVSTGATCSQLIPLAEENSPAGRRVPSLANLVTFLEAVRRADNGPVLVVVSSSVIPEPVEALDRILNDNGLAEQYFAAVDGTTDDAAFLSSSSFPEKGFYLKEKRTKLCAKNYQRASDFIRAKYFRDEWVTSMVDEFLVKQCVPGVTFGAPDVKLGARNATFGAPDIKIGLSAVKAGAPGNKFGVSAVKVGTPNINIGLSAVEVAAPDIKIGLSAVKVGALDINAGLSAVKVGAPDINAGLSAIKVGAPHLNAGLSAVEVGALHINAGYQL